MANIFFDFSGSPWYKVSNLVFHQNVICTTDNSKLEEYDPFYYYNNPIPSDIITDILGENLDKNQPTFIHTLFLSLDPSNLEQVKKWVLHFGLLNPFDNSEAVCPGEICIYEDFYETYMGSSWDLFENTFDENKKNNDYANENNLNPIFFLETISGYITDMQAIVSAMQYIKTGYGEVDESLFSLFDDFYFNEDRTMKSWERHAISSSAYWENVNNSIFHKQNAVDTTGWTKAPAEDEECICDYYFSPVNIDTMRKWKRIDNVLYCKDVPMLDFFETRELNIDGNLFNIKDCRLHDKRKNYVLSQLRNKNPLEVRHILDIVKYYFNFNSSMIHPIYDISENGLPSFRWKYDSLNGLILFLIFLDISANKSPNKCKAKNCSRYFIPTRKDAIYCSETCKNRARQQRHRAKSKIE